MPSKGVGEGGADAIRVGAIALSLIFMNDDSSWTTVASRLRSELEMLAPGDRIPTHRQLVARFAVSATTVSRALASLGQAGLIETRPGAGSFRTAAPTPTERIDTGWQEAALRLTSGVDAEPTPRRTFDTAALETTLALPHAEIIDLNGGYLHPDLQPTSLLSAALARVGRRADSWQRPDPAGLPSLRDWFASDIGSGLTRHDLIIVGGGQAALSVLLRALAGPGDPVVVETPTYPGLLAAARAAGLRVVPVGLDGDGIRADDVDRALTLTGARVIVTQPVFQNPTGVSMSAERRTTVLDIARRHRAFVVEDDFARRLVHVDSTPVGPPLIAADRDGAVVHVRSLTKATSPNLRVAAIAGRGPVMARIRAAHVTDAMFVPAVLQHAALEVVTAPGRRRAAHELARHLAERRATSREAVMRFIDPDALAHPGRPDHLGGFHLWLRLPRGLDDRTAVAAALSAGVAVTPGSNYSPDRSTSDHLRVSYVAAPSAAEVVSGIERLGSAMRELG